MLRRQNNASRRTDGLSAAAVCALKPPTVLLTGFDPFGGAARNPSWLAAHALQGRSIAGHRVIAAQLPTVFGSSLGELAGLLKQHRPALVLCLGLAGGRNALSLERVAINLNDARMADNAGEQPIDSAVVPGGPAAYFSSLPIKAMLQALQQAGIAAELSQSAGTFVCNQVFYGLMQALAARPGVVGGFIHLPPMPEQAARHPQTQTMPLAEQLAAMRRVVGLLVAGTPELRAVGGRVD